MDFGRGKDRSSSEAFVRFCKRMAGLGSEEGEFAGEDGGGEDLRKLAAGV